MLRNRDLNVQNNRNNQALKPGAAKHKTVLVDEKDGPTRPKRAALGDYRTLVSQTCEVRVLTIRLSKLDMVR
jgi:hypothetical protein